jgi:hypothetical protein
MTTQGDSAGGVHLAARKQVDQAPSMCTNTIETNAGEWLLATPCYSRPTVPGIGEGL